MILSSSANNEKVDSHRCIVEEWDPKRNYMKKYSCRVSRGRRNCRDGAITVVIDVRLSSSDMAASHSRRNPGTRQQGGFPAGASPRERTRCGCARAQDVWQYREQDKRGEDQVAEGKKKKKTKRTEDKVCRDKGNKSRRVSQSERRKSGERALISDKAGLRDRKSVV